MSFYFVNIDIPGQGISSEIRSHVMQNHMRQKVSRTNSERLLYRHAKQNRTQSRITKLRPQKTAVPGWSEQPPDTPWSDTWQLGCPQDDPNRGTVAQLSVAQNHLASHEPISGTTAILMDSNSNHKRYHYVLSLFGIVNWSCEEQVVVRNDEQAKAYVLELMLPFSRAGPQRCIGSEIDPFHTLPQLSNALVNIEKLKKHCSTFFGTEALGRFWVPTILRARHSFLSCMCLGASHHDIMRGFQRESAVTIALKTEVIREINENLVGPVSKVTDLTIIAILQVLAAEIVNGDQAALKIHLKGLEMIMQHRGGLQRLGLEGLVAGILAIMVFLVYIMHGHQPHSMYTAFFSSRLRPLPFTELIPESPIYCPQSKYFTIILSRRCSEQTYDILCNMHDLTTIFLSAIEPDLIGPIESIYVPSSSPASILRHILAKQSAALPDLPISNDWVYESCRLAAVIYCGLFNDRFPSSGANTTSSYMPLVHKLRDTIARTDTGDCWGDMAGVLYWCVLVAGVAMRRALRSGNADDWSSWDASYDKDEHCRRWITLLVVRLSVVLGFQYPDVVTTTLRRFIRV